MQTDKLLFRRMEAAQLLGISVRAVDYLIQCGKIRVRRLGRRVLIPRAELERFAAQDAACIVPQREQ